MFVSLGYFKMYLHKRAHFTIISLRRKQVVNITLWVGQTETDESSNHFDKRMMICTYRKREN